MPRVAETGMAKKEKLTQWHPAFCSAIELTFIEHENDLDYRRDYPLNTKALEIDLVVVKKKHGSVISNPIGRIFRENNIIEYKSPKDKLMLGTFYKVMAYACLYKCYDTRSNPVPHDSLTITMVRMSKPEKLFNQLDGMGYNINKQSPGIYVIEGDTFNIPMQVVVTKELRTEDAMWLKAIQTDIDVSTAASLVSEWNGAEYGHRKMLMDSVMQVAVSENEKAFSALKGDESMCQALMDLMKPEFDQAVEAEVKRQVAAEVKRQVAAEVKRQVAAEVKRQVAAEVEKADREVKKAVDKMKEKFIKLLMNKDASLTYEAAKNEIDLFCDNEALRCTE